MSKLQPDLQRVIAAFARPGQPETTFQAVDRVIDNTFGRAWTTILLLVPGRLLRIFTSIPGTFPVGGVKPLHNAAWARTMLQDHSAFYAESTERIAASYLDHATPLGLGVVRIANVPIVLDGELRAVLCINGREEHRWGADFLPRAGVYATALGPVIGCYHPSPTSPL